MERVKGIEPSPQAWEARVLPLNYTRYALRMFYQRGSMDAMGVSGDGKREEGRGKGEGGAGSGERGAGSAGEWGSRNVGKGCLPRGRSGGGQGHGRSWSIRGRGSVAVGLGQVGRGGPEELGDGGLERGKGFPWGHGQVGIMGDALLGVGGPGGDLHGPDHGRGAGQPVQSAADGVALAELDVVAQGDEAPVEAGVEPAQGMQEGREVAGEASGGVPGVDALDGRELGGRGDARGRRC